MIKLLNRSTFWWTHIIETTGKSCCGSAGLSIKSVIDFGCSGSKIPDQTQIQTFDVACTYMHIYLYFIFLFYRVCTFKPPKETLSWKEIMAGKTLHRFRSCFFVSLMGVVNILASSKIWMLWDQGSPYKTPSLLIIYIIWRYIIYTQFIWKTFSIEATVARRLNFSISLTFSV